MRINRKILLPRFLAVALAITVSATGSAVAGPGHDGGFRGPSSFHGSTGFRGGSVLRGGFSPSFGGARYPRYSGGAVAPYRDRYVGRYGGAYYSGHPHYGGGYYGGGYYGGGYGGRGWWGLGLFLPVLPLYYETLWWGGLPYYYADHAYYVWDGDVQQYQAVVPPAGLAATPSDAPSEANSNADLYAYPKDGQSTEQQASDRAECRRWAASQTGNERAAQSQGYRRAEAACLQAHNYSVN